MLHPSIPPGPFDLGALLEYEPPVYWRPDEGEKVVGPLVKADKRISFGRTSMCWWLLVPPEAYDEHNHLYVVVRCAGVVLKGAADILKPRVGEKLALKYEGMRPTTDGAREYRYYQVAVLREGRNGKRWVMAR